MAEFQYITPLHMYPYMRYRSYEADELNPSYFFKYLGLTIILAFYSCDKNFRPFRRLQRNTKMSTYCS
jgi:hypothetical protein